VVLITLASVPVVSGKSRNRIRKNQSRKTRRKKETAAIGEE